MTVTEHTLIVGHPGQLVAGLTREALAAGGRVTLLPRPEALDAAVALQKTLSTERVQICPARLLAVDLGLSAQLLNPLLTTATHVFHAAAVRAGPRHRIRRNAEAFANLLELTRDMPRLERLSIFSTAFVSGDRAGLILEDELEAGQRWRTPFERSMFQVERIACLRASDLPITILRPTAVLTRPTSQQSDDPTPPVIRWLTGLPGGARFPLPGTGDAPFNVVPLPFLCRAAWALAHDPRARGRALHLTDPTPVSARRAFELIARPLGRPEPLFAGRVGQGPLGKALRVALWGQLSPGQIALLEGLARPTRYDQRYAAPLLEAAGVHCPTFEDYAEELL